MEYLYVILLKIYRKNGKGRPLQVMARRYDVPLNRGSDEPSFLSSTCDEFSQAFHEKKITCRLLRPDILLQFPSDTSFSLAGDSENRFNKSIACALPANQRGGQR